MQEAIKPKVQEFPLFEGQQTYERITDQIARIPENPHPPAWTVMFGIGAVGTLMLITSLVWLLIVGLGIWGINQPVAWGFAIINFVWWIGIGHAGTLISAILLLLRQAWRMSINRFAEAMTIFAVMCAGLFPLFHTGRPWVAYWLFPLPNWLAMWPQFRSPLEWDVFAVSTYFTVSVLFWYMGLIPDLATMRDRAKSTLAKVIHGILSWGWRGSAVHWLRYEQAYLLLAGLSTPLVLSVHSIVSLDFAISIVPGWHVTIFPPYFVAGAIFSGFAMVLTLVIPFRILYPGLREYITMNHIDWMAKVMLATGWIVFYGYLSEMFFGWYSANQFEQFLVVNRFFGPYWLAYWALIFCNGVVPQLLWIPKIRHNLLLLFIISIIVNIGMWFERFVIVVISLHRDFLTSAWGQYAPTIWDWSLYLGTIGFFIMMMFLFARFVPMLAIAELKDIWHRLYHGHGGHNGHAGKHAPAPAPTGKGGES
ncbi:quinol:cytochrome c oxidoreductase quinone-binding subunit 1 [Armatimonadetes bacterium GBS]|jgi:molybdopterin-containing oxidoreductase family membrane subunit|nr:hypothetical protein HRbin14_01728 [bacterium HR14]GIV14085.1 MAG: polysulfide reductase NrfD [Fimbriimonadales bacterium]CUU09615.1 quinol:cytochrome c oxidoreductase quinone-binding subunit 1 [Armatimonadetes bacterium GBS]CUU35184.1 quinol:cytochrome c oxidoreductase quinone-binding subunit 1 [Armatimonadetes bacterium GXS]CUU37222.1 quinol:cytochrome c oxidoreductase quinone-binding subunit 1 [Armatimonadetes bacterium DC]